MHTQKPAHDFKTTLRHRKLSYLLRVKRQRAPGICPAPQRIVLDVRPGVVPSGKTPVRIFIGTEAAQFRAERVLIWSIVTHRDPSRCYEIYLMKDLVGFDRRNWKTGFTCYRYAVPALAGATGRAIYNDVDQIYLADPAALFDMDMHGKGQLGINERENSVMLVDCEPMSHIWHYADAQRGKKHREFRSAVHAAGLWGPLPGVWNARDGEYVAGESRLLHFTTLQTQPWRPFPQQLRYREHPLSEVWGGAERDADATGFTVFTKERPSQRYLALLARNREAHEQSDGEPGLTSENSFSDKSLRENVGPIAAVVRDCNARTILDYGSGTTQLYDALPGEPRDSRHKAMHAWDGVQVTCFDPDYSPFAGPIDEQYDGVICMDRLAKVADDDIPWVFDELFRHARRFVYVIVACGLARKTLPSGENAHVTLQPASWWREQMEAASRRHMGVKWVLCVQGPRHGGLLQRDRIYDGGGATCVS